MSESRNLAALERELEQLQQQLPRHSIPPTLLARIEELEEEIAARKNAKQAALTSLNFEPGQRERLSLQDTRV